VAKGAGKQVKLCEHGQKLGKTREAVTGFSQAMHRGRARCL